MYLLLQGTTMDKLMHYHFPQKFTFMVENIHRHGNDTKLRDIDLDSWQAFNIMIIKHRKQAHVCANLTTTGTIRILKIKLTKL
jgi:hypothetical protein